ncbi:ABC transporter substrate-binding protein [Streptomyces zingiberis]|uniref:ABC transporter substrate-binding protein n=1 Tax=Streptomyces zingiberis TaxID=2053010 RepID=A0ABX1BYL3_9ACTN|nr:ABC transporter substrate-binding protein [Streptomyces zingiberis]NJQ01398.1 ABC transporter substrate-binding protein [Streptomyces zingiberis]
MRARQHLFVVPALAGLLAGCGGGGSAAGTGEPVVMGMTDEVTAVDPASGYDPGSWLLFNNVFQSLISFPRGGTTPQPEAAERCGFEDSASKVYRCTLKDGLTFSGGNRLTSEDVAFSFRRTLRIDDENGPAVLLSSLDKVETPDDKTVIFRLKTSDATFPMKIASGAGSIVDHREYPADRLRTDGKAVGSGVYTLDSFDAGSEAKFSVNPDYQGPARVKNSGMTMKFYRGNQGALKEALRRGDLDLAYRGLSIEDISDLETATTDQKDGLEVIEGTSAEVQHLVFNLDHPVAGKEAVRKAVAYLVDRSALVRDVYKYTAKPLYSIVPSGITAHNTAFFDLYGDRPQPAKAEAALRDEGITEPVELTLHATPSRYGPGTVPAFEEIAEQLNAGGLFDAKVESTELGAYEKGIRNGDYGVYVKGWVPDYPDPDNFTAPFFGEGNVLGNNYDSERIVRQLIPSTAAQANRAATASNFGEVQDIVAEELPVLPLWQGKQYAVARGDIAGLEWSLDASTVFRFWEISKAEAEEE